MAKRKLTRWSEAKVERLRLLATTTLLSADQIGAMLGVSASAVTCKCDREKIKLPRARTW